MNKNKEYSSNEGKHIKNKKNIHTNTNMSGYNNYNNNYYNHRSDQAKEIDLMIKDSQNVENEFENHHNHNCYPSYPSDENSYESKKEINFPINEVHNISHDNVIVDITKNRHSVNNSENKIHSNSNYSKISNKLNRTSKTE
jgi:hypothetical protein